MKIKTFILLFFITTLVQAADSFDARVQSAKDIEDSTEGRSFQKVLWGKAGDYTAKVMQRCFPKNEKTDTGSFTLVANLIPGGTLTKVEIQPVTKMAQCFAEGFSKAPFPEPPHSFGNEGMPLVIAMKIEP